MMYGKFLALTFVTLALPTVVLGEDQKVNNEKKIRLYACYTPSHEELVKSWFLPSIKDNYEIMLEQHEQTCPTAVCRSEGWTSATLKKVEMIIRAIHDNWGSLFVYSDVDIQFFKPTKTILLNLIQNLDMVVQRDDPSGTVCTGFFMCRANQRTLNVWQEVQRRMTDYKYLKKNPKIDDQTEFNKVVRMQGCDFTWNYLPDTFLSGGTLTGKYWNEGDELIIPSDIVLHHANWTPGGIKNKIAELIHVRKRVLGC